MVQICLFIICKCFRIKVSSIHDLVMYRLLFTMNPSLEKKNWKFSLFFFLTNELMDMEAVAVIEFAGINWILFVF